MSLTETHKQIVQTTFAQVADPDALAARFYARLFESDPSLQALFHGDMAEQRKKLMQTLAVVVSCLNGLDNIVPAIKALGVRHVAYGVVPAHYDTVGAALLWALEDAFGPAFTAEVRESWAAAYGLIASTAIAAAYPRELAS
jgi:hemoglobin-like flavoprotein